MIICDDSAIAHFGSAGSWKHHLYKVKGDRITLLQLSDLHFKIRLDGVNAADVRKDFGRKLDIWKRESGVGFPHGFLLSGDFVHGEFIGKEAIAAKVEASEAYVKTYKYAAEIFRSELFAKSPFDPKRVLTVPGNHDVVRGGKHLTAPLGPYVCDPYEMHFAAAFTETKDFTRPAPAEAVDCPRLCLYGNENGVIALIGLDSNHNQYRPYKDLTDHGLVHVNQLERFERLVGALSSAITDCPLHVCVAIHHHLLPIWEHDAKNPLEISAAGVLARVTLDARNIIDAMQRCCVSLVTHGHMHKEALQQVAYLPLRPGGQPRLLSVASCPSYEKDDGAALLTFDLYTGQASVQMIMPSRGTSDRSVGTTVALMSASRIPSREMRLYRELTRWMTPKGTLPSGRNRTMLPAPDCDPARIGAFRKIVDARWRECGYVQVSGIPSESVSLPVRGEDVLRSKKYFLLVLLRGGPTVHILLNNHVPLRTSEFSSWDTLLFPAFQELREELEHARRDLVRAVERLSLESNKDFKSKIELKNGLIEKLAQIPQQDWERYEGDFRLLGTREFIKFSPTDGQPQRYEYNLVSLDAFAIKDYERGFTKLFETVDSIDLDDVNCGMRPDAQVVGTGEDPRPRRVPLGLVWFPLEALKDCPSILARNCDVVTWVNGVLEDIRNKEHPRRFPSWLLLGEHEVNTANAITVLASRPFQHPASQLELDQDGFPYSLERGMLSVKLQRDKALANDFAYRNPEDGPGFERVILRRVDRYIRVICVTDSREVDIGVLRPTQRYVLKKGMDRVRWLAQEVKQLLDLEGYLKVRLPGGSLMAILPPVIEAVADDDRELPDRGEFLVCDGNHRIVQHCWFDHRDVRAVLARKPNHPYYAFPFSAREWNITAENQVLTAPDLYSKYAPRPYGKDPKRDSYRTYFRDFNTGFKNVGGQGGRAL